LALIIAFLSQRAHAQYDTTIVCDNATDVKLSSDGSLWTACSKNGLYALVQYAPATQTITRTVTYGAGSGNQFEAVSVDTATLEVYAVGRCSNAFNGQSLIGGVDIALVKVNSVGTVIWTRIFGSMYNDFPKTVYVDSYNQFVYVAGNTYGYVNTGSSQSLSISQCFLSKYSAAGQHIWTVQKTSTSGCDIRSILVAPNNANYIYAGGVFNNVNALFTVFSPDDGSEISSTVVTGVTRSGINALAFSLSGSTIFAAGYIQGSIDGESASGLGDGWVTEFNLAGTKLAKSLIYGSSSEDAFEAINVDFATGNIWVTGW
ncbi:hypothetical protein MIR68_010056, partial [Amoeboaphelidium protococcarum]